MDFLTKRKTEDLVKFIVFAAVLLLTAAGCLLVKIRPAEAASITSAQSGNWSSTATWTGGVVPGDGDFVNIGAHTITIDQNIGSVVGGGIKRIKITSSSGKLLFNGTANTTIVFGSTGTDPVGTGTASVPGDDATMFGIFNSIGGQISLAGTASGTLTITTADDTSPWYLYSLGSGSDFTMTYVDAYHLGTLSSNFQGIVWSMPYSNDGHFYTTISHCRFTDLLTIYEVGSNPGHKVFTYNYFTGVRASSAQSLARSTFSGIGSGNTTNNYVTVTDNTENNPVNDSIFWSVTYTAPSAVFQRNVIMGTSSASKGLLSVNRNSATISDNIVINSKSTAGPIIIGLTTGSTDTTASITGNYIEGSYAQTIYLNAGASPTISGNFFSGRGYSWAAQGIILVASGKPVVQNNVMLYEDVDSTNATTISLLYGTTATVSALWYHNTMLGPPQVNGGSRGGNSLPISIGEPGFPIGNNIFRDNLIAGWLFGIYDASGNTWTADYAGVGIHHNAFYDNNADYYQPQGQGEANFWDGVHDHPDAVYGEVSLSSSPGFVDKTRRLAGWDTTLGGAGTNANAVTEFAKRSGWGGTYNSAYTVPALLSWVLAGFAPTNESLKAVASDGTDIGAVSVADVVAPTVSLTAPSAGTVSGTSVTMTASASDTFGVSGVKFYYGSTLIGSEDTSSPYSLSWDSSGAADGSYSLVAVARDAAGNVATSSSVSVTVDNTAPALSSISAGTPGQTSATVTWTTDEAATSQVNYGSTAGYGSSTTFDSSFSTSHSATITGLSAGSTYHFNVVSQDSQGNSATSSDQTFSTATSGGGGGGGIVYPLVPNGGYRITVNNGQISTHNPQVSLTINGGSDVIKMMLSSRADFQGAVKEAYQPTKSWNLCQAEQTGGVLAACPFGTYVVYVKLFNNFDKASAVFSASINYLSDSAAAVSEAGKYGKFLTGSLVKEKNNSTIYYIYLNNKIPFTSLEAFLGLGYSLSKVQTGDLSTYQMATKYFLNSPQAAHPSGSWLINAGTVYYLIEQGMIPIPTWDIFIQNSGKPEMILRMSEEDLDILKAFPLLEIMSLNDSRVKLATGEF